MNEQKPPNAIEPEDEVEQSIADQIEFLRKAQSEGAEILIVRDNNCAEIQVNGKMQRDICGRDLIWAFAYLFATEFMEA